MYVGDTSIVVESATVTAPFCAAQAFQVTMEAYWKEYLFLGILMAAYIVAAYVYGVTTYNAWSLLFYCLCHLVGPILLCPAITSLAY
jgi:predicted small integral membrane protein